MGSDLVEPCPLKLTPSASIAVMLAISDAVALTLMELKAFTKEDYGRRHHSGYPRQYHPANRLTRFNRTRRVTMQSLDPKDLAKHYIEATRENRFGLIRAAQSNLA